MKKCKRETKYVSTKKAKDILGVHTLTLHNWDKLGKIETMRTIGNHRMYNIEKYLEENETDIKSDIDDDNKQNICYVRVSTHGQKDDMIRQKKYMQDRYPDYTIIEDIGSGINFNRKGLRKIIKMAISGKINTLVIAYKDRLTRFGFDLIEDLIKDYSGGRIIIENEKNEKDKKETIVEDVLQILNVYTAKINGLRKYNKHTK